MGLHFCSLPCWACRQNEQQLAQSRLEPLVHAPLHPLPKLMVSWHAHFHLSTFFPCVMEPVPLPPSSAELHPVFCNGAEALRCWEGSGDNGIFLKQCPEQAMLSVLFWCCFPS